MSLEATQLRPPPVENSGFRLVRLVLGVLLLASAGLKAHGLVLDPLAGDSFLGSPRMLVATIEIETVLGLWLLSGWAVRASWVAALGFFGILAGVSFYLGLTGQQSCGCLGRVTVSPWWMFALDVAALAALALWRPARNGDTAPAAWLTPLLKIGAGSAALLAVAGGVFLLAFDNPAEALARLRGDSLTAEPVVTDVGEGEAGDERTFRVQLTNRTDRAIRIVGGTTKCSCVATRDLPLTLSKGEAREIEVSLKFVGSPGRFQRNFVLFTDDETQRVLVARFSGRVNAPPE